MNIFNIHIEFDSEVFCKTVENFIAGKQKAYVCVVDANVLTMAQKHPDYRKIVNEADINTCDGSSITKMANTIYGTHYKVFAGPELFAHYIEKPYRHILVGNTPSKVAQVREKVLANTGTDANITHVELPFCHVDDFDYEGIAKQINDLCPDFVWVSLGAPKQEIFISKIFPYINQGVLFAIGAAFNFYTGDYYSSKKEICGVRMIWLGRIFKEPKKQLKRVGKFILMMPRIFFAEKRRARAKLK